MEAPDKNMPLKVRGDKKLPEGGIERLLIRGTNWIGDVVMTLPALAAIRARWPQARIAVLAKPWVAEVYRLSNQIDEVIIFEEPGRHAGALGKLRLAKELRGKGFDCAILLQNAIEAALLAKLAAIPRRAGYNSDGRGFLLTHSVRRTAAVRRVRQSEYYLEMVRALGCRPVEREPRLQTGEDYAVLAESLFSRFGIAESGKLIGISPGAAYGPAKRWFPDRFAAVADSLNEEFKAQAIVFGSKADQPSAAEVQKSAHHQLIDVAGKTNLQEAIALIARCDIFLSNDSGLMHVAGALGIPTVAIFGSTNPATTSPAGAKSVVIHHDVPCSPCLKPVCPTDFGCMKLITIAEVLETARKLLQGNPASRPAGRDKACFPNFTNPTEPG
ncbi:MAG: lipopolysaccharide heptosyltransferase II [Syntrophobacterales bacterium]|nr:lipopolysaccharide heptosyltransferase II [Syntrophobacterales bacterium]